MKRLRKGYGTRRINGQIIGRGIDSDGRVKKSFGRR